VVLIPGINTYKITVLLWIYFGDVYAKLTVISANGVGGVVLEVLCRRWDTDDTTGRCSTKVLNVVEIPSGEKLVSHYLGPII